MTEFNGNGMQQPQGSQTRMPYLSRNICIIAALVAGVIILMIILLTKDGNAGHSETGNPARTGINDSFGSSPFANANVGDIIKFSSYEQDNNSDNGTEPIEWKVLEKRSDGSLLAVSRYGKVVSFGDNSCGQCDVTPWASVREIYAGENISAAVDADGNMLIAGSHSKTLVNDGSGSLVSSLLPSAHSLTTQHENEKIKDDYDYCFENNHITITGYRGNLCNVSMPDEIDKTRIEKIGERAFKDNDFITNISLLYHLIEIGDSAFWGCTELRTVSHYDSDLERIGENAFWNCTS